MAFEMVGDLAGGYELTGYSDEEDPLEGSIEKWQVIVDFLRAYPGAIVGDGGAETCALCLFHKRCASCPVFGVTRRIGCLGTPHDDWRERGALEAAEAELKFLEGLRSSE